MHHKINICELREWSSMNLLELLLTHSFSLPYASIQEAHKQAVESLKELPQLYLDSNLSKGRCPHYLLSVTFCQNGKK